MSLIAALLAAELAASVLPPRGGSTQILVNERALPADGVIDWHFHPGAEVSYVLEGEVQLRIGTAPPITRSAGEAFIIGTELVHAGRCLSASGCKVLVTHYLEAGQPESIPALPPTDHSDQPDRIP